MATIIEKLRPVARHGYWPALMRGMAVMWRKQMRGLVRSPSEWGAALAMPAIWMVLFGLCMGQTVTDPARTGGIGYLAFITPGVMLLSVLTAAAMAGATLLLDRMSGALKVYVIAPVPQRAILLGLLAGTLTKALAQSVVVLLLGLLLGARLGANMPALHLAGILLGACTLGFGGLATAFAGRARSMEGYHGLIMLLNLPLLFVSNALYAFESMPAVIRMLAYANPVTYAVDGLRHVLFGAPATFGLALDIGVLLVFALVGLGLGARSFAHMIRRMTE